MAEVPLFEWMSGVIRKINHVSNFSLAFRKSVHTVALLAYATVSLASTGSRGKSSFLVSGSKR